MEEIEVLEIEEKTKKNDSLLLVNVKILIRKKK